MRQLKPLADTLRGLNIRLFDQKTYSSPKRNAQMNLRGITHYADDDTLRYFFARIVSASDDLDGAVFWIIESVAIDPDNAKRGYRYVVFDVWGTVIGRVQLSDCFPTKQRARKGLETMLGAFDCVSYYQSVLANMAARAERDAIDYHKAFEALESAK